MRPTGDMTTTTDEVMRVVDGKIVEAAGYSKDRADWRRPGGLTD
jgi:hypothetical protein